MDSTRAELRNIALILQDYKSACGSFPTTENGLKVLDIDPGTVGIPCRGNANPTLNASSIEDGWEQPFTYTSDGKHFRIDASLNAWSIVKTLYNNVFLYLGLYLGGKLGTTCILKFTIKT